MKKTYTNSELMKTANAIRIATGCSQKEAFAEARKRFGEQTVVVVVAKGRGHYVRDDAWRAKHAEDMRKAWARRREEVVA